MRGTNQAHGITHDLLHDGDILGASPHIQQLLGSDYGRCGLFHGFLSHGHDVVELICCGKFYIELEHETVSLRFGKRIRTVLLNGVLGSENEKRLT